MYAILRDFNQCSLCSTNITDVINQTLTLFIPTNMIHPSKKQALV